MSHPGGHGGEEVHGQQQGHHQLDHHGHHEGGDDDRDGRTSRHGFRENGRVRRIEQLLKLRGSLARQEACPYHPFVSRLCLILATRSWSDPLTCCTRILSSADVLSFAFAYPLFGHIDAVTAFYHSLEPGVLLKLS